MSSFPNENSVLVLDNARIHGDESFQRLAVYLEVHVVYLPPYSPHLNPCELFFNCMKQFLIRNGDLSRNNLLEMIILIHGYYDDFDCYGAMRSAGYFDYINID